MPERAEVPQLLSSREQRKADRAPDGTAFLRSQPLS